MNVKDKIKFWKKRAQEDFNLAEQLFRSKDYLWCLFLCQLSLEKAIKALVVKITKQEPPHVHDLVFLAKLAEIELNDLQIKELETISRFHIEARYEDYKQNLKKKAQKDYTEKYLNLSREYLKWFLRQN